MSTPELKDLIARYFEGELGAADEARLEELLDLHPEVFERFKGLVGIEGLLRARETEAAQFESRAARLRSQLRPQPRAQVK